jgi:hypothetical protein
MYGGAKEGTDFVRRHKKLTLTPLFWSYFCAARTNRATKLEDSIDKSVTVPGPNVINLDRWMGRREAFGTIAGRCSATEVLCLREIRNNKLYLDSAKNWDEFCRVQLGGSRKKFDTALRQLEAHGPQFFHATQILHLSEAEYIAFKEHMTEEGLRLDGEVIAWIPENSARLTLAAGKLRANAPSKPAKQPDGFDALIQCFQALNRQLEKWPAVLDDRQRQSLGEVLRKLSYLAERRGIKLVQR